MSARWKSIRISILLLLLVFVAGKSTVRPTLHYLMHHTDVPWELVELAVMCPTRAHPNPHYGKGRYTFLRKTKRGTIEIHAKVEDDGTVWVINAFRGAP
jgi:hypothetical protein